MNMRQETFVPLIHTASSSIDDTPDLCQTLQLIDVMSLMSVANVSMQASMLKHDIFSI